jgi:hypothetical protein
VAATFQPCRAKCFAVSLPRPLLAPVISIVFATFDIPKFRIVESIIHHKKQRRFRAEPLTLAGFSG